MTLVAFDFDGTLSDSEMTVLLGAEHGVYEEMAAITERAMHDEIDYAESVRRRARLLEGLPEERAEAAFDRVRLRPGAGAVIERLHEAGVTVAVITGGFERGVASALTAAGVDAAVDTVVANRLPIADGRVTGAVEGPLIEGQKDDALAVLAAALDVDRSETVAIGDGANDRPMLEAAGLAVGYEPKPAVGPACDYTVASMAELEDVLSDRGLI